MGPALPEETSDRDRREDHRGMEGGGNGPGCVPLLVWAKRRAPLKISRGIDHPEGGKNNEPHFRRKKRSGRGRQKQCLKEGKGGHALGKLVPGGKGKKKVRMVKVPSKMVEKKKRVILSGLGGKKEKGRRSFNM